MERRALVAGNWKMHKTPLETEAFIHSFLESWEANDRVEVVLLPPFTGLERARGLLTGTAVVLGGQDLYFEDRGAFTGEISVEMLRACGCRYALVGHSERRALFHEDDLLVNRKIRAALASDLHPILCVGEILEERRRGRTEEKVLSQLGAGLDGVAGKEMRAVVIAYEPVWAIGTGETATAKQAQEVVRVIRGWVAHTYGKDVSEAIRILYGGSVTPENTASLLEQRDIDGLLVGGASLSPDSFARIVRAAMRG